MNTRTLATLLLAASTAIPATAAHRDGFGLEVLVNGAPRPELHGRGSVYVEALKGREYALRLTNPLPYRVAVALSVDGLNTIDAKHGEAATASKWVLGPYETVEIEGWQVSGREARRFFFTGERSSYGAWLGETDNLGVIEAVFYREQVVRPPARIWPDHGKGRDHEGGARGQSPSEAPAPQAGAAEKSLGNEGALSDEYAATGIGDRTEHQVQWVDLRLEKSPAAVVRLRYEFRPQLVKLGLLPEWRHPSPLDRRERARGFDGYCPAPPSWHR
jgi:hypothetical protein